MDRLLTMNGFQTVLKSFTQTREIFVVSDTTKEKKLNSSSLSRHCYISALHQCLGKFSSLKELKNSEE